jgi:DNA polymerase III epsilon subunit-like protein
MNLLIIDTETTGLDHAQSAELIEVGAILEQLTFDWELI